MLDLRAVVCGHTTVTAPMVMGNHLYIDTKGWRSDGYGFTVLDAATLQPARPPLTKSESGL
jgi:serine/threonine protein phosphatase 1